MDGKQSPHRTKSEFLKSDVNLTCGESHLTITSPRKNISVEKKSNEANQIALHTTKSRLVENVVKNYKMIRMPKYRRGGGRSSSSEIVFCFKVCFVGT